MGCLSACVRKLFYEPRLFQALYDFGLELINFPVTEPLAPRIWSILSVFMNITVHVLEKKQVVGDGDG